MKLTVEHGTIFREDGVGINDLAILYDKDTGSLHKYGEVKDIKRIYTEWKLKDTTGLITENLIVFVFDSTTTSIETICATLNKMINTSGYCALWHKRLLENLEFEANK